MKIKRKILNKVSTVIMNRFDMMECSGIASLGKELLAEEGIEAEVVSGYAAFRVGEESAATISYNPDDLRNALVPEGGGGIFHVWLEVDNRILDFSCFVFRNVIKAMDDAEGVVTKVDWNSDYLYTSKASCSSMYELVESYNLAWFYQAKDRITNQGLGSDIYLPIEAPLEAAGGELGNG